MLQIAEAGSVLQIAEGGLARPALKLRIVYHQLDARIACGCSEDCLVASRGSSPECRLIP
jgi:hypothetical protein